MKQPEADEAEPQLCPKCGTVMVTEDGETYCPKCAAEIDWGLGEDDGTE